MSIFKIIILAIVQGFAELLPVSSSAHVVVAEKLMGLDASSPQMTLMLVMLHTGTMFAVIVYFWNQWKKTYFSSGDAFKRFLIRLVWASVLTVIIGGAIKIGIEKTLFKGSPKAEIEDLFGRLDLIAPALAAGGLLILLAGLMERRRMGAHSAVYGDSVTMRQAGWIGAVQGLCLPFRGFSRSGATISTGMLTGASKERAERFSFALAVVLTPPVVGREVLRLVKASHEATAAGTSIDLHGSMLAGLLGAFFAFLAGLVALKWLSSWLEAGRWYLFGVYCLIASVVVFGLYRAGY
jgi:undecaprenyl-diphosphatase